MPHDLWTVLTFHSQLQLWSSKAEISQHSLWKMQAERKRHRRKNLRSRPQSLSQAQQLHLQLANRKLPHQGPRNLSRQAAGLRPVSTENPVQAHQPRNSHWRKAFLLRLSRAQGLVAESPNPTSRITSQLPALYQQQRVQPM